MTKLRTHYDNLKVSRDAPDFVIRAAYKTLTQKYHPDRHPGDERAARIMTLLNTSYGVLSDPERRAEHDAWIAREESKPRQQSRPQSPPIPPAWQQPPPVASAPQRERNVLLMLSLLAFVIVASVAVWLLGSRTPARPPPADPKPYQTKAPPRPAPTGEVSECRILNTFGDTNKIAYSYVIDGVRHFSSKKPPGCDSPPDSREARTYVRPATAPNNSPWPTRAAYVKGYPVENDDGHSKVTVDNARNDADVFVKLVSLDGDTVYPVRQFFIPARSRFTLDDVSPGKYDIRYLDLNSGGLSRSESFDVEETSTTYSTFTLTLYKVQGGNFKTYDLSDSEF